MSFIDSNLELWDDQALTASEESRTNGDKLDMEENGATDAQLDRLFFNVLIGTAFAGMASGARIELWTSDSATFASGVDVIASFGSEDNPLSAADLAAGEAFSVSVPTKQLKRYVQANFDAVNEEASAGKLGAWLGMEPIQRPMNIQKEPS